MKIKDLVRELSKFDENLDVEVYIDYKTGRVDKFEIQKIAPCIHKGSKEIIKAIVKI